MRIRYIVLGPLAITLGLYLGHVFVKAIAEVVEVQQGGYSERF